MRLRSGLVISTSAAFAAGVMFACTSFEASELPTDGGPDLDGTPVDAGTEDPPRRWCAAQDASLCDDFDGQRDASFAAPWDALEIETPDGGARLDDVTWRSPPFGFRAEATSLPDGGVAFARLAKTFPAPTAIEVAFDMYVERLVATGAGQQRAFPVAVRCAGGSEANYGLFVEPAPAKGRYAMLISDGVNQYPVPFANAPALQSWKRVVFRFGIKEQRKPFVAVDDPDIDLIPVPASFNLANAPTTCAVFLGSSVVHATNAAFHFDNVVVRLL